MTGWVGGTTHLQSVLFVVVREMHTVLTGRQAVPCHPLVHGRAPLSGDPDNFSRRAEVHLKPLVGVVESGRPAAHVAAVPTVVEAGQERRVVVVPARR